MRKQIALFGVCLVALSLVFVGGCGKDAVRVEEQVKPEAVRWVLPKDWVEKSDRRVNLQDEIAIEGFDKGGRFTLKAKFVKGEGELLKQINICRESVSLPKASEITINHEDTIEKTFGRLFNLPGMAGEVNGGVLQVVENRTIIPIQDKPSHLFLCWIKYDAERFFISWYADKGAAFMANNAAVGQFVMTYEFPRLSITEQRSMSYTKAEINESNMAFVKVLMKNQKAREAMDAQLGNAKPADTKNASSGGVKWDLPKGWVKQPKKMFSFGTFHVDGNPNLLVKVSKLGLNFGDMTANVNRWRGEVGLAGVSNIEGLKTTSRKVDGTEATVYRFDGPGAGGKGKMTSHVVMFQRNGSMWFYKLIGAADDVASTKKTFDGWIDSIRY